MAPSKVDLPLAVEVFEGGVVSGLPFGQILHLTELLEVFVVVDACIGAEPLAHLENALGLDESVRAGAAIGFKRARDDVL